MSSAHRLILASVALVFLAACAPGAATTPTAAPATAPTSAPAAAAPTSAPKPAVAPPPAAAPGSGELVVFAASSLTDVFQDMATAFQQANPNAKLTFNFGASTQPATQHGHGAPTD